MPENGIQKNEAGRLAVPVGRGAALRYTFNASAGHFTVQAFATGLLSAFGHSPTIAIRDFDGKILCSAESFTDASMQLRLRTTAMEVLDDMKTADRQRLEE